MDSYLWSMRETTPSDRQFCKILACEFSYVVTSEIFDISEQKITLTFILVKFDFFKNDSDFWVLILTFY